MSDSDLGAQLSPEENAFFESGGDSPIPSDTGADNAGSDSGETTASTEGQAGDKGADPGNTAEKATSTVPLAALKEERNRRRDLDKTLRETQTQLAELRGKFSIVERLNLPGGEKEQAKGPIDPEADIFGAVRQVGETVAQLQKRQADETAAREAATKAETERNTFVSNYRADVDKFKATTPDFMDGYNFLLNSRAEELKAIGYDTPQALHEALTADEYALAEMAFSKGKSPAEMFYTLAKQRGYAKKDGAAADTGKGAEKLATIERGQQANKSLNNTGGSSGDADMTAERLIGMPIDEFESWVEKNPAKARRIMGG